MSKIINGVASEYEIPIKSTIVVDNDYDNLIKREDKPFIWISEEIFTLKRDKDKLQQENQQLKEKEELHLNRIDELTDRVVDLESVIEEVSQRLEYYLIGNMKYEDSQKEFKKLLQILNKTKEL